MRLVELIIVVALVCASATQAVGQQSSLIGKPAPGFVRTALDGKRVNLDDFRGKVILLNFWASWCGPCRVELPIFSSWQSRYGREGLRVITLSMDDDAAQARKAAQRLHLSVPVVMGDERLGFEYGGVLGLPVTYLIGRDGKIVAHFAGETDLKQMESRLRELLFQK